MSLNLIKALKHQVKLLLGYEFNFPIQAAVNTVVCGDVYGGFEVSLDDLSSKSVVYAFGIGENLTFDLELIHKTGCTVHAFDPTPRSIEWTKNQELPKELKVYEFGIANIDGQVEFEAPRDPSHVSHAIPMGTARRAAIKVQVYRLATIMKMLGHDRIDLLKMDIEGAEYGVMDDFLAANIDIDQIAVEFHVRVGGKSRTRSMIKKLNDAGYWIIACYTDTCTFKRVDRTKLNA